MSILKWFAETDRGFRPYWMVAVAFLGIFALFDRYMFLASAEDWESYAGSAMLLLGMVLLFHIISTVFRLFLQPVSEVESEVRHFGLQMLPILAAFGGGIWYLERSSAIWLATAVFAVVLIGFYALILVLTGITKAIHIMRRRAG